MAIRDTKPEHLPPFGQPRFILSTLLGEPILAVRVPAAAVEDTIGMNTNCITERGQRVKCAHECAILPEPRSKAALLEDTS